MVLQKYTINVIHIFNLVQYIIIGPFLQILIYKLQIFIGTYLLMLININYYNFHNTIVLAISTKLINLDLLP